MKLKISEEEFGRFLLAYYRGIFNPLKLGAAFLFFYDVKGFDNIRHSTNDNHTMDLIVQHFTGTLQ